MLAELEQAAESFVRLVMTRQWDLREDAPRALRNTIAKARNLRESAAALTVAPPPQEQPQEKP
jgi:hypothetical protein